MSTTPPSSSISGRPRSSASLSCSRRYTSRWCTGSRPSYTWTSVKVGLVMRSVDAEAAAEPLHEGRLAGAEVAGQHDDVAGPGQRRRPRRPGRASARRRRWWRPRSRRGSLRVAVAPLDPRTRWRRRPRRRSCRGGSPTRPGEMRSSPCGAEQHDLVADPHVAVGPDVDHHLVHRDHADHRVAAPADEHLLARGARAPRNTPSA